MSERKPLIPPHVFWPGMVIALICLSLTMATITVIAAVRDPSFVVEKDYYNKALRWDESQAERERVAQLGWTVEPSFGPPDQDGSRPIVVTLHEAQAEPIEGAAVRVSCFHHAQAAHVLDATLSPGAEPGVYQTEPMPLRLGFWTVRIEVDARGERWAGEKSVELHRE